MDNKITDKFHLKKAFTLAEVLLTIAIIGVVAVITVPVISQATGRQEYVAKLKKAHSVLGQTLIKIAIQEGLPVGDYSFIRDDGNSEFFDIFTRVVDPIKICNEGEMGCIYSPLTQLNGLNTSFLIPLSLVTKDGMAFGWNKDECAEKGLSFDDEENCVGCFIVDINGHRKPNRLGYDVFFFTVVDGKGLVPAGKGNNSADCFRTDKGVTCAAKVIKDSAINYM